MSPYDATYNILIGSTLATKLIKAFISTSKLDVHTETRIPQYLYVVKIEIYLIQGCNIENVRIHDILNVLQ